VRLLVTASGRLLKNLRGRRLLASEVASGGSLSAPRSDRRFPANQRKRGSSAGYRAAAGRERPAREV